MPQAWGAWARRAVVGEFLELHARDGLGWLVVDALLREVDAALRGACSQSRDARGEQAGARSARRAPRRPASRVS